MKGYKTYTSKNANAVAILISNNDFENVGLRSYLNISDPYRIVSEWISNYLMLSSFSLYIEIKCLFKQFSSRIRTNVYL